MYAGHLTLQEGPLAFIAKRVERFHATALIAGNAIYVHMCHLRTIEMPFQPKKKPPAPSVIVRRLHREITIAERAIECERNHQRLVRDRIASNMC